MQVNSPSREQILGALRSRTTEQIQKGSMGEAEQTQRDMVTLSKAKGETLYDMHRLASDRLEKNHFRGDSFTDYWVSDFKTMPVTVGGILGGIVGIGGLAGGSPVLAAVGLAALGGAVGFGVYAAWQLGQAKTDQAILQAAERHNDYVRAYTPAAQPAALQIDRKVFLAALQGQEAKLAENGLFSDARDMRRVHEALSQQSGATVEAMFEGLMDGQHSEVLALVQGKQSARIAETIDTIAQVGKLVGPGPMNGVREDQDSLVIGGVVLKKR